MNNQTKPDSAAPGGDVEQRARELLADEYERDGITIHAHGIRNGGPDDAPKTLRAIRAIIAALSAPKQVGTADFPNDATDLELVQQFLRVCREMRPVGQWPGERLCVAIERLINGPRDFIAEADMSPYRDESGRVGFRRRPAPQPGAEALRQLVQRAIPFLRDEGANYADDGSNEPLELARELESLLARGG